MEYVTVASYDWKMVRVQIYKKEEYIRKQKQIKMYLEQGKDIEEIKEILKNGWTDKRKNNTNK